jgi:hypothetical protein
MPRFLTSSGSSNAEAKRQAAALGLVEGTEEFAKKVIELRNAINASKSNQPTGGRRGSRSRKSRLSRKNRKNRKTRKTRRN